MKILGIVGGIGAGKSTVTDIFEKNFDIHVINTDKIGHEVLLKTGKAYDMIIAEFGTAILDDDGEIIREKLANIVFCDEEKLKNLNSIMHPCIYEIVVERIKQATNEYVLIEAALLIESGFYKLADIIIGVYADEDLRIQRIMNRNNYTYEQAKDRINAQLKWKDLRDMVDIVIDNSNDIEFTTTQVIASL
ncbi:MAG: dephospho-CoA kinase [Epulopiscium sp. Nuni2H_MBin001]|nr:MAG: dephospho-CoA kinase [Epulopiscium sp. Nuni2H_MBin001]